MCPVSLLMFLLSFLPSLLLVDRRDAATLRLRNNKFSILI